MKKSFLVFLLGITLLSVALAFFCSAIYYQKMYFFLFAVLFGIAGLVGATVGWVEKSSTSAPTAKGTK